MADVELARGVNAPAIHPLLSPPPRNNAQPAHEPNVCPTAPVSDGRTLTRTLRSNSCHEPGDTARRYALDPRNSSGSPPQSDLRDLNTISTALDADDKSRSGSTTPEPRPTLLPSPNRSPKLAIRERRHRKNVYSIDSVPRQTIMKALVSRPPPTSNMSITSSLNGILAGNTQAAQDTLGQPTTGMAHHRQLSEALSGLHLNTACLSSNKVAALASPCFFHKKFDHAVNIDKVLEEISDSQDEGITHSRLMQTATGVREVSKQLQRRPVKITVRNVMIVTKARDNHLVTLTRQLAEWLLTTPRYGSDVGINVYVDAKLRRSQRFDAKSLVAKDPRFETMLRYWTPDLCWSSPEKFDLVLTLGGDGTVLYTSWLFQRIVPPILSFSLGSLGFLTNFKFPSYKNELSRIMGDAGMRVNLRMRFTCTVYRAQPITAASPPDTPTHIEAEQFEVLNELVIDRGPSPYVSNLELYGDEHPLTVIQADGCIFSTPTGSTAYSLSAGGSLVHPDIPAILLTPICPHTLSFRPMILSDSMLLRVAVPRNSRATAYCAFDGKGRVELRQGDHVTIAASQYPFPTVLSQPTEWFDAISRTLRWNTRGAMQKGWDGSSGSAMGEALAADLADSALDMSTAPQFGEPGYGKEEKFDIDIDDDDAARDSGYSAEGSSAGGGGSSPVRRAMLGA